MQKRTKKICVPKKFFPLSTTATDKNDGPFCLNPAIPEPAFLEKKESFLKSLKFSGEERANLEKNTSLQYDSALWLLKIKKRLSVSNFGSVVKTYTKCDNLKKKKCIIIYN